MKPEVRRLLASLPKSEEAERLFHPDYFTRDGNPITEVENGTVWYAEGRNEIGEGYCCGLKTICFIHAPLI